MKHLFLAGLLFVFSSGVFAKEMIFYKYAEGDGYSVLVASADEAVPGLSARDVIARKMTAASFSLEDVPSDYYSVKATSGIAFYGENVTQYEITPLTGDRFSHVVWLDGGGNLIKTEIYDGAEKLMFAFSSFDFGRASKPAPTKHKHAESAGRPFFKGFAHIMTKRLPDGVTHLMFTDGLNRFSVFINPHPDDSGTVSKIVYGNYLMSKVVSGVEYTVIGSVPYSTMEEFIKVLNGSRTEIGDMLKTGALITDEVYTKKTEMEEILK